MDDFKDIWLKMGHAYETIVSCYFWYIPSQAAVRRCPLKKVFLNTHVVMMTQPQNNGTVCVFTSICQWCTPSLSMVIFTRLTKQAKPQPFATLFYLYITTLSTTDCFSVKVTCACNIDQSISLLQIQMGIEPISFTNIWFWGHGSRH